MTQLSAGGKTLKIINCFNDETTVIQRTMKDGKKKEYYWSTMLKFYNEPKRGVGLTDQIVGLYDFDLRSNK